MSANKIHGDGIEIHAEISEVITYTFTDRDSFADTCEHYGIAVPQGTGRPPTGKLADAMRQAGVNVDRVTVASAERQAPVSERVLQDVRYRKLDKNGRPNGPELVIDKVTLSASFARDAAIKAGLPVKLNADGSPKRGRLATDVWRVALVAHLSEGTPNGVTVIDFLCESTTEVANREQRAKLQQERDALAAQVAELMAKLQPEARIGSVSLVKA
jgi:hypothetical protein